MFQPTVFTILFLHNNKSPHSIKNSLKCYSPFLQSSSASSYFFCWQQLKNETLGVITNTKAIIQGL